jgi:hypothetical protein
MNYKKVTSVIGICVGVITISSAIVGGLGTYYGIPEIKSNVKELKEGQKELVKDVSEIKGMLKGTHTVYEKNYYSNLVDAKFMSMM